MSFRMILSILAITVTHSTAKPAMAQATEKQPPQSSGKAGHLEVPRDPFIKIPRAAQLTSPAFSFVWYRQSLFFP